jgi:hypothetical protein
MHSFHVEQSPLMMHRRGTIVCSRESVGCHAPARHGLVTASPALYA